MQSVICRTQQTNSKGFLAICFGSKIQPSSCHYIRIVKYKTLQFYASLVLCSGLLMADFRAENSRQKAFTISLLLLCD
jgi:hypothetical protein